MENDREEGRLCWVCLQCLQARRQHEWDQWRSKRRLKPERHGTSMSEISRGVGRWRRLLKPERRDTSVSKISRRVKRAVETASLRFCAIFQCFSSCEACRRKDKLSHVLTPCAMPAHALQPQHPLMLAPHCPAFT